MISHWILFQVRSEPLSTPGNQKLNLSHLNQHEAASYNALIGTYTQVQNLDQKQNRTPSLFSLQREWVTSFVAIFVVIWICLLNFFLKEIINAALV